MTNKPVKPPWELFEHVSVKFPIQKLDPFHAFWCIHMAQNPNQAYFKPLLLLTFVTLAILWIIINFYLPSHHLKWTLLNSQHPCLALFTTSQGILSGLHDSWTPSGFPGFKRYNKSSAKECLRIRWSLNLTNVFVFMGDSTMLLRANVLAQMFGITYLAKEDTFLVENEALGARVEYYRNEMLQNMEVKLDQSSAYFIFGSNLWYQKISPHGFAPHQRNLDLGKIPTSAKMKIYLERLKEWVEWVYKWHPNIQVIYMYQDMVMPGHKGVTNAGIAAYNEVAAGFLKEHYPRVTIWSSGRDMSKQIFEEGLTELMFDSIHLSGDVYQKQINLFINYLCSETCIHEELRQHLSVEI